MNLADPMLIGLVVLGFIASRALGGIIGEYAKRIWFGKLEPHISKFLLHFTSEEASKKLKELEAAIDSLEVRNSEMTAQLESLYVERCELTNEVIMLRMVIIDLKEQKRAS